MHERVEAPQCEPVHCAFVLKDRKPCKFAPVQDSTFCAHHRLSDSAGAVTRVACPVDPTQYAATRRVSPVRHCNPDCHPAVLKSPQARPPGLPVSTVILEGDTIPLLRCSTVPLAGLNKHLERCPKVVQRRNQAQQPFYRPGCNDGSGDEVDLSSCASRRCASGAVAADGASLKDGANDGSAVTLPLSRRPPPNSAERAAHAAWLGDAKLLDLIARVRQAHAKVRWHFAC